MEHPFEEGKQYRNRKGQYTVLIIDGSRMQIRYEDGTEQVVTVATQERIWNAMLLETEQHKKSQTASKAKRKCRSNRQASDFTGLKESDFKSNVAGTSWRRRGSLGGTLAQQLTDTTAYDFQSYSIYRRPEVHIVIPRYYDSTEGHPFAKLILRLFDDYSRYGFYIERADKSRVMDSTWHWQEFLKALQTSDQLTETLNSVMIEHGLSWLIFLEKGDGTSWTVQEKIEVQTGSPLIWRSEDKSKDINWGEFVNHLQNFPSEQWLNIHFCVQTGKEEIIAAKRQFANTVTAIYRSILPLYLASIGI